MRNTRLEEEPLDNPSFIIPTAKLSGESDKKYVVVNVILLGLSWVVCGLLCIGIFYSNVLSFGMGLGDGLPPLMLIAYNFALSIVCIARRFRSRGLFYFLLFSLIASTA